MKHQQSNYAGTQFPKLRILIPARGQSTRIPHKNLQELVPGKSLLQWSIEFYKRALPGVPIHVATECHDSSKLATSLGCQLHGRVPADIVDARGGWEILRDFMECYPGSEVLLAQCTSPFTYRTELYRALLNPLPYVYSAYQGTLHTCGDGNAKSQDLPVTTIVAGNFAIARQPWGVDSIWRHPAFASQVSWLSAIDINTHDDLEEARKIASRITLDHLCQ